MCNYKIPKCGNCGSSNILKDAYAEWDSDDQEWVLQNVFDHSICDDCGIIDTWDMVESCMKSQ